MKEYSLPIEFEKDSDVGSVVDDRFIPVKIYIAHTGENRNRSIFSKEVLESMIPSLTNVPILGYIALTEENEEDFHGHEERLVIEDGQIKLRYVGHAYGVIPSDNNAHFEFRYGEDGVEREYLVCNGLLWKKFPEVEEIFDRDGGFKSQSMELQHSSVKGYQNEEGLFVFEQAKCEGACILGEGVTPAMISSTIEKFSVADKIQNEMSEMLTEFNAYFSTIKEKGDVTVEDNKQVQENENTEFENEENPVEEPQQTEETPAETPAENFEEGTTTTEEETPAEEPVSEEGTGGDETPTDENFTEAPAEEEPQQDGDETPAVEDKFTRTFELAHDDIRTGLYQQLDSHEQFSDTWVWISKVYDSYAIVEDEMNGKFFKVNYVKHESAVSLGEFTELFPMFLTQEEKATVDASRNNFEALEQEVLELREFKSKIEYTEKEEKLAQYSSDLSKEEYDSLKENLNQFSVNDIEKEIGFMLLKKNKFSAQPEDTTQSRVSATNNTDSNPYGSASVYFSK